MTACDVNLPLGTIDWGDDPKTNPAHASDNTDPGHLGNDSDAFAFFSLRIKKTNRRPS
jgi:hypothetical protein